MNSAVWGALLGAVGGLGFVIVAGRLLASRRPSLESRVAPFIRDVPTASPMWRSVVPRTVPLLPWPHWRDHGWRRAPDASRAFSVVTSRSVGGWSAPVRQ